MPESIDRSRRGFFTGSLLTREGKEKVKKQITRLGLIPPGLTETVSAQLCQHCKAPCVAACPQNIIRLHPADHELNSQPWLDFEQAGCTFCGECAQACPHHFNEPDATPVTQLGKASIDHSQCYAWLDIICMSCISVCPLKLIKFGSSRKPDIMAADCTGCGSCIQICPAGAIKVSATQ